MRHRKVSTQKIYDEFNPAREAYLIECPICAVCNAASAEHVHEMICGTAHRMNAFKVRACWLGLCPLCHRTIQSCVSVAKQLAWKLLQDPVHYNRSLVLTTWGRADTAVTDGEVIEEVRSIIIRRTQDSY